MRKRKKNNKILYIIITILLLITALIFYVWQRINVTNIGYKLQQLNKQINSLEIEKKNLELKIGSLSSLDHIEKIATEKLGMVKIKPENIVTLNSDSELEK